MSQIMKNKSDWDRGYKQAEKDIDEGSSLCADDYENETSLFISGYNDCLRFNGWTDMDDDPYAEDSYYDVDATGSCYIDSDPGL